MSKGLSWFKFYPSDWLNGTRGLTVTEVGLYISLIAEMYDNDGNPIKDDRERFARVFGLRPARLNEHLQSLIDKGKITVTEDGLWNARVMKERTKSLAKRTLAVRSAEHRWGKKDNENYETDDANASDVGCERNANQSLESRDKIKSPHPPPSASASPQKMEPELPFQNDEKPPAEPKPKSGPKGSRIPDDYNPDEEWAVATVGLSREQARAEAAKFRDYWTAKSGAGATKLDWPATWRLWARSALDRMPSRRPTGPPVSAFRQRQDAMKAELDLEMGRKPDVGKPADFNVKHSIDH